MSKIRNTTHIYEPNSFARMSLFRLFLTMVNDLLGSISLGWRLFLRDFSAKYRQQALGFIWAVVVPLIAVAPFILMNNAAILKIEGVDAPYSLYAFTGVTFWHVFQGVAVNTSAIVNNAGPMISKINFPRESLLISPLMVSLVDFAVRLLLFILLCLMLGHYDSLERLYMLPAVLPALFFGLGMGMFLSIIGAVFKDIATMLSYFFQFVMLATPILYQKPAASLLGKIAEYNPLFYLVTVPRDLIINGTSDMMTPYWYCTAGTAVFFLAGWRFYKVAIARIIEKV